MFIPCINYRRVARAFSLIELTIALGIVGFALVAILGLVPLGLKAFQDAMRMNVEAEIVQSLARELENTPWKTATSSAGLPTANPPDGLRDYDAASSSSNFPIWFDDEGRELARGGTNPPAPSGPNDRPAAYGVVIRIEPAQVNGGAIVVSTSTLLYRARIFVAFRKLDNLASRVSSGTIAAADRPWIKEYPVILAYKGY